MRECRRDTVEFCDVLIAGGGAAGMAAALKLAGQGRSVLLAERQGSLGGVLCQCVHSGFGRGYFGTDMTGQQYAAAFAEPLLRLSEDPDAGIRILTDTTVLRLDPDRSALLSSGAGVRRVSFGKCLLATGCRERTVYSQLTAGSRPAGVMTCGTAQRLMNLYRLPVEGPVVILGTGDIGQIVARQLMQNGTQVLCMIEQNAAPGGRQQNRKECIEAFHIPVRLRSTIVRIIGENRIQAVLVRNLENGKEEVIKCRTLLTAIGLIPETELADDLAARIRREDAQKRQLQPDWLVRTGNSRVVHDIVDSVTIEAEQTAASLFREGW